MTPTTFTPDEKLLTIMSNFCSINPSILIEPDRLVSFSPAETVLALYPFPNKYDFDEFGFYDGNEILSGIKAMTHPTIEVYEKYINIIGESGDDKLKYFTAASLEDLKAFPDLETKTAKLQWDLEFQLTADKLAIILKMANILKADFIFLEIVNKKIRITVTNKLESSDNSYDIVISDGIKTNQLTNIIKIRISDFKILTGEYEVKIHKKMSKWNNLNGVTYFIATTP